MSKEMEIRIIEAANGFIVISEDGAGYQKHVFHYFSDAIRFMANAFSCRAQEGWQLIDKGRPGAT